MTNFEEETRINSREFRNVMGLFATGITVVATEINGETHGMTANALTSVSLDPLLILVCVHKEATLAQLLQESGQFSVNILSEDREDLSNFFAGLWPDADSPLFKFYPWVCGPRLEGALGALACKVDRYLDGGDHWIITGRVVDLYRQNELANPLLYYQGRYRRLLE